MLSQKEIPREIFHANLGVRPGWETTFTFRIVVDLGAKMDEDIAYNNSIYLKGP